MDEALPLAEITYFMRRLSEARRIPGLSPVLQFEIARLPITDDTLEQAANEFGAPQGEGWGITPVLEHIMSQSPGSIPVDSLKQYQEKLVAQGYVDPGTSPTGTWDPMWQSASRRMERDAEESVRSGYSWSGGPVEAGIRAITNTLPSLVWQGVIGAAKGLAIQTPETAERAGAIGGAAIGAGIGAVLGGGAGAIPGAAIGGAIGFFADLLTSGEGEQNQSGMSKFIDALSPYEEYKGDPRAFWEDLGYVGTAASLISGAKMAVSGAQAGMAGIRAATVGAETTTELPMVSRMFPGSLESTTTPGAAISMGQAAMAKQLPTLPAGLTTSQQFIAQGPMVGIMARVTTWATSKFAPGTAGAMRAWIAEHGLISQMGRPGLQLVNKVYTGAVGGSLGARFAAGFTGPRVPEWKGQTTIEKAIADTAPLGEGTLIQDFADLASFLIIPERFVPWAKGSLPGAIDRLAGTQEGSKYARIFPFAHVAQQEGQSFADATQHVLGYMTPPREMFHRVNFGIDFETNLKVEASLAGKLAKDAGISTRRLEASARYDIVRKIHETLGRGDQEFVKTLIGHSMENEGYFVRYLNGLGIRGSGIEKIVSYDSAEQIVLAADRALDKSSLVIVDNIVMGRSAVPTGAKARAVKTLGSTSQFDITGLETQIAQLNADAQSLRAKAARSTDGNIIKDMLARSRNLEDQAKLAGRQLAKLREKRIAGLGGAERMRVSAMRLDTPSRGDFLRYRAEYISLRNASRTAWDADPTSKAAADAFETLKTFTDDLVTKGVVPRDLAYEVLGPNPSMRLADFLKEEASYAARDIALDPETVAKLKALGYKPVLSGQDLVFIEDVDKLSEAYGLAEYSRKSALIESLGFSPRWRRNTDVYAFRIAAEEAEFEKVMQDFPISGDKVANLLHAQADSINHATGVTKGPFIFQGTGRGVAKTRMFLTDLRDLTVEDIYSTKGLADLPGFTMETAQKLYTAVRRSAALGGEVKLMPSIASLRVMGRAMRVNGLPGFSDAIRTMHSADPAGWSFMKVGALTGAGIGAYETHKEGGSLQEIIAESVRGAALGAAAATPLKWLAARNYGYLPDRLVKINTALRFSLSLTFDAGRYMEQNMIAHSKYGLPFIMSPEKYVSRLAREGNFKYEGETITDARAAWKVTTEFWDEVNGTTYFKVIDDIDRRMYMHGLLGFSPRDWEAAQAMMLYQKGMRLSEIKDAVSHIGRYGPGRVAAEKSANFVFFPFSFSKKLLTSLGDFMISAPARAFVLHEGWRRYTESTLRDDVNGFLERHLPLLQKLWTINNLSYGLSPGRFFLSGLTDNRTALGNVMFALGTVFVPSGGAATTAAQAAASVGDLGIQAFSPIIVTGESIKRAGGATGLLDIVKQYIPFTREINTYFFGNGPLLGPSSGFGAQWRANPTWLGGQGLSPYSQYNDYVDSIRQYKDELTPYALAMGYASVDGLLSSDVGLPLRKKFDDYRMEMAKRFPTGAEMSQQFENTAIQRERAIRDISEKVNRSEGEDAILRVAEEEWKWRMISRTISLPAEVTQGIAAKRIYEFARKYANDRRFQELWDYLFAPTYGPITTIEVV